MPGILEQNVVCLCDPVGFRETLAQRGKFLVRKPQRGLQALLLRLYPLLAAFMLVPKTQPLLRHVIEVGQQRSEEHTSELQSLMRISYAVFCLKKTINTQQTTFKSKKTQTHPTTDIHTI